MSESPMVTRRALRREAHRVDLSLAPVCDAPVTRRSIRAAQSRPHRFPTPRQMVRTVPIGQQAAAIAVGLALAGGMATGASITASAGGVSAVTSTPFDRTAADAAASARLTARAAAYADQVRVEALDSGTLALARLDAVRAAVTQVGADSDLTGLETTTAELAALLTAAGVEVGDPGSVVVSDPGVPIPGVLGVIPPEAYATPATEDPTDGAPQPSPSEPVEGALAAPSEPARRSASPSAIPVGPASPSANPVATPASDPAGVVAADVVGFDMAVQILALAQEAEGLADSVQAEIDAVLAAAEELARNVAEVESHDNGAILVELLCAPSFAPEALLRCDAVAALEELNLAFVEEFDKDLEVTSSYRDYSAQVATRRTRGGLAARPGTSNHGLGLAVDLAGFGRVGQFGSDYYRWMKDNSEAYGWFHPEHMGPGGSGPREPWHWEFDPALLLGEESTPLPGID